MNFQSPDWKELIIHHANLRKSLSYGDCFSLGFQTSIHHVLNQSQIRAIDSDAHKVSSIFLGSGTLDTQSGFFRYSLPTYTLENSIGEYSLIYFNLFNIGQWYICCIQCIDRSVIYEF